MEIQVDPEPDPEARFTHALGRTTAPTEEIVEIHASTRPFPAQSRSLPILIGGAGKLQGVWAIPPRPASRITSAARSQTGRTCRNGSEVTDQHRDILQGLKPRARAAGEHDRVREPAGEIVGTAVLRGHGAYL